MKLLLHASIFAFTFGVSSCNSCTEEVASRLWDIDADLDGDGDSGDRSGKYNPSFKGKNTIKNSCNIRRHNCGYGIDRDYDGWCDNCMANGFECHIGDHQPR